MKLSELEGKILGALGTRGDATVTELAALVKTTPHKCRYSLEGLFSRKLLRRRVIINADKVGYSIYAFCFSLTTEARPEREKIERLLIKDPRVGYFAECSGRYEYRADILARDAYEVGLFFSTLGSRVESVVANRAWSTVLEIWDFPIKRLYPEAKPHPGYRIGFDGSRLHIDDRDQHILRALCEHDTLSHAAIARLLKIPPATLEFRVKSLKERGVIVGYHIVPQAEPLRNHGMNTVVFRIRLARHGKRVRHELEQFARRDPLVFSFTQSVGDYDAELCTLLADAHEERAFIQRIESVLGPALLELEGAQVREHRKVWNFPGAAELHG